ncbi:MAG: hypothetical protein AMS18_10090 [Gemmatimonas sp. SG8_17]|nr:MAG: hypothetical protein AMS18_10090 [Gemmatimonas sp. SG8_17]
MYKLFKGLVVLGFMCGLLAAGSYAGARVTVGKFLGSSPPLAGRTLSFSFTGVEEIGDRHAVWVIEYATSQLPGVRHATFYVSPMGGLIATIPPDLDARLETWERSRDPAL